MLTVSNSVYPSTSRSPTTSKLVLMLTEALISRSEPNVDTPTTFSFSEMFTVSSSV